MEQTGAKEINQAVNIVTAKLLKGEQSFFRRILKNHKAFLVFTYAGIGVAAILLILYTLILDNMNGTRFALIIMVLLQARANLKLYKVSKIFQKINEN